ncbi:MAG: efflux RND transporter periplasmic adaptor subunit [Chitinophagaceae bacterium]|nr:efflux RND transporter periplasmic adaptor subunit [Chitinophagaceae bacterium]
MKSIIQKTILVASVSLFLFSCGSKDEKSKSKAELAKLKQEQKDLQTKIADLEKLNNTGKDSVKKVAVRISLMEPSVFNTYITVPGKVDLDEVVNAIPETPGIISSIRVKPGQYVKKGQVVATLRSETIDRGISQLDQSIAFAKTMYDKQKRLWAQEIGTEIQLLSAKNQYESLLKQKQTTLSSKSSFNVYSPISGVVDAVDAAVGQSYANPMGAPLIRIINTSKLKIRTEISENYVSNVKAGSNVLVVFPSGVDTLVTKINYVEKVVNNVTRSYAAYIPLPNNPKYLPNMAVSVKIATYQNARAFVLPQRVIQKTDNGNFVFVVDEKMKAKLKPVQLGMTYEGNVEVLSGLNLSESVITTGFEELNEGDALMIAE